MMMTMMMVMMIRRLDESVSVPDLLDFLRLPKTLCSHPAVGK